MPIAVDIQCRTVSFWTRIINNVNNDITTKLSSKIYKIMYYNHSSGILNIPWIENVKNLLCLSGYSGVWYSQQFVNSKWLIKSTSQKFKDLYIQKWRSLITQTTSTNMYKYIKADFTRSSYINTLPFHLCKYFMAFRTRNHRLPIETGRWHNIPVNERYCNVCNKLGDEYHFLIECSLFKHQREIYLDRKTFIRPSFYKFSGLLNIQDSDSVVKLANLRKHIVKYKQKGNNSVIFS